MLTKDLPGLTLANLGDGAAEEMFQDELKKVVGNCLDPNTVRKAKRTVTIKVTMEPNQDRNECSVAVEVVSKGASRVHAQQTVWIGHSRKDGPVTHVYNPRQYQLDLEEAEQPKGPRATSTAEAPPAPPAAASEAV